MKDDFQKPLYDDFKKQVWDRLKNGRPIQSRERFYDFADRPFLISVFIELIAAFLFIYLYLPKPGVYGIFLYIALYVLAFKCVVFYVRRFVYRYARFQVLWEDWSCSVAACDNCDEQGKFLRTKENRNAAIKSRFAFTMLLLTVAAVAVLFYIFAWGSAEQRVRSGGQLEAFARIAEKQGDAVVEVDSDGVEVWSSDGEKIKDIGQEDEEELRRIFGELQWNYVESLYWMDDEVHVFMHGGFESKNFFVTFGQ